MTMPDCINFISFQVFLLYVHFMRENVSVTSVLTCRADPFTLLMIAR
jgi:hypothetical protein